MKINEKLLKNIPSRWRPLTAPDAQAPGRKNVEQNFKTLRFCFRAEKNANERTRIFRIRNVRLGLREGLLIGLLAYVGRKFALMNDGRAARQKLSLFGERSPFERLDSRRFRRSLEKTPEATSYWAAAS